MNQDLWMRSLVASVIVALAASCERVTVREYEAPKETFPRLPALDTKVGQMPVRDTSIHLKVPPAWREQPAAPMRKASFIVEGTAGAKVDISVTSFPAESGGLLANINRWRGQIGLDPVDAGQLEQIIERRTLAGREFVIVDYAGEPAGTPTRLIGAILPAPGETWFFKMTGDDVLAAAQKPAFLEALESVQFRVP